MRNMYIVFLCLVLFYPLVAGELPRPSYDNSTVIAFAYYLRTATTTEVDYLKSQFGGGLYAPLVFTNFAVVPWIGIPIPITPLAASKVSQIPWTLILPRLKVMAWASMSS